VDLCSGAGKSAITVAGELASRHRVAVGVTLTDKYPNVAAFRRAALESPGTVTAVEGPVEATDVPSDLGGFWTMFTSFHHFKNPEARRILANAVRQCRGIGVFEYTERNLLVWGPTILAMPLFIWLATPFIRPLSWRRVLWTNLLPVIPFLAAWDGLVSCLRTIRRMNCRADPGLPGGYRWADGCGVRHAASCLHGPHRRAARREAYRRGSTTMISGDRARHAPPRSRQRSQSAG
jgi:hypothetical protein